MGKSALNTVTCSICGSENTVAHKTGVTSVYSPKAYSIVACKDCNHRFTHPRPTAKELDTIYGTNYAYTAHLLIEDEKKFRARTYADTIAALEGVNSVLEIGCMHGFLVEALGNKGLEAEGVEIDGDAVKICQDKGLNVSQASFESFEPKNNQRYDAIVMSHVLEHIVDPVEQMAHAKSLLKPGGKFIIVVPNSLAKSSSLSGKYWGYWQVPVHINHFNGDSIRVLFKKAGYETKEVRFFGADSLFFLSTLANLLGSRNSQKELSLAKKALVVATSKTLRPWVHVGSEDMMAIAVTS